ncbi:BTB/POZ domain-containing protein 6-like [Haliotis rufescens]|uniref:BTB/POZ domain-containing protein 6-like n=1 Tax=Haliotis rufescens TaxID=6454 RepID=UPI00201EE011|nr:BTB/POZ domain-containing protein 6-like [Haliotis rufescens]
MATPNPTLAVKKSGFADNWQAGKTLAECNLRMFSDEDSCDVTFQVGSTSHVIKAHRYVLISRSCVFHAMLSGPRMKKSDISVPEIEYHHFKQFLIYLYTDHTKVDVDNATALLYASRKYAINTLESCCLEFLDEHLSADNACIILKSANRFGQSEFYQKALALVKGEGERSLQSPDFLALGQMLVDQIVESDDLVAREHVVFNAVNSWAEAECRRKGREATPDAKRSLLGGTLMKVRFPHLEHAFLREEVKNSGLLTDSERLKIFDYTANSIIDPKPFNAKPRARYHKTPIHYVKRLTSMYKGYSWKYSGKHDAISFYTNRRVMLTGYQLYGNYSTTGDCVYSVTSYLGNDDTVLYSKIQDTMEYKVRDRVYDVMLENPVTITAGDWYTLAVKIKGPITPRGDGGVEQVVCDDGVQFNFRNSNHSKNGTKLSYGQIPSLIYRLV